MIRNTCRIDGCLIGLMTLCCVVMLWVTPVGAYVLQGPHVLDLMVRNLAGAQTLVVSQTLMINDPAIAGRPIELQERLSYQFPDRFRSDIQHEQTQRIYVYAQGQTLTVVDGAIVADSKGRFDRYKDLFLYNSRKLLHKVLSRHGVDVGITSLGRMEDRVVYVIGANYPDEAVSQLWVDKERLVPLRWINIIPSDLPDGQPERLEFIYNNWQKGDGVWYPWQIETFHNQASIRKIQVTQVKANAAIGQQLLNISHLMTQYQHKEGSEPNRGAPVSEMEEVQRTLDEFRKKFDP